MSFVRLWFFASLLIGLQPAASSQNLVPNGSFEEHTFCPGSHSQHPTEFRVVSWRSISNGSPDYFNTCSAGEADVPYNWAGVSEAYEGNGYAGIYTWMAMAKDYREYIHCKLNEPLIRDSAYHIEFRYKLSSYSKFSTDRIGLLLSDSLKNFNHDEPIRLNPTFSFVKDSAINTETGGWEIAAAEYKAKGNEQFLTIGNFADNATTKFYRIQFRPESQPMLVSSAYYYIDDVSVTPRFATPQPDEVLPVFAGEEPALNKIYVLENIQFAFNSYDLLPVSHAELNKVLAYLAGHTGINVRLSGHTDNIGNSEYNRLLSSYRAQAVASYLITGGINRNRIVTFGFGEAKPLSTGDDAASQAINRRVEIEFYE
jgi:outer membrane protein OmpA-like peptidoglycan-associated protein